MEKSRNSDVIIDYLESLGFALAIVVLLFTFFLRVHTVSGHSMDNTLADGDKIVVSCLGTIDRGDIVVIDGLSKYGLPLVKRVIGLEGDVIDVDGEGHLLVNGEAVAEPYVTTPTTANGDLAFPITVEPGKVFLMGDNRMLSKDSRNTEIGQVDRRDIFGKAFFRILPFSAVGSLT